DVESIHAVAFSFDGKFLATGTGDNKVKVWSLESGEEVHCFEGHTEWVFSVAFSEDGTALVSEGGDDL
ncbi:quinon protein alcohol dehydrogenase-like superfamily, partial [Obelidium mucronatum]